MTTTTTATKFDVLLAAERALRRERVTAEFGATANLRGAANRRMKTAQAAFDAAFAALTDAELASFGSYRRAA